METGLAGQAVLVTGASGGIGGACARAFAAEGARVVLHYHRGEDRARDVFFGANLVYFLMLLVCGVNIANDDLPGWLGAIGRCLPLTHGIEAGREIVAGTPLSDVSGLLVTEALIGLAYATAAYALFRVFEAEGRRRASLETY